MRHRRLLPLCLLVGLGTASIAAHAQTNKPLNIYVVDVEGGNATLFAAPSGQSVLIDTGNGGPAAARDAGRILAAAQDAGIAQIDHLITTHWHGDHFGAMAELAGRIPIKQFIDQRERVRILHRDRVQPAKIYTESLASVWLVDQDYWCYPGADRRSNNIYIHHALHFFFDLVVLRWGSFKVA